MSNWKFSLCVLGFNMLIGAILSDPPNYEPVYGAIFGSIIGLPFGLGYYHYMMSRSRR